MASLLWIPVIFAAASSLLYVLSTRLPDLAQYSEEHNVTLAFPSSLDDLRRLTTLLSHYKDQHAHHILLLFSAAYFYKQTFAIPGSVFLNVLAGALFGLRVGFTLSCMLTTAGATCCYFLSKFFGKEHVLKYFPEKLASIQHKVTENADGLFFFLLFLRLFPMTPNWFLNAASPVLNIPLHLFSASVFIGLMPYNYICVETGCILSQVSSINDVLSLHTCLKLAGIASATLIPGLLLNQHRHKHAAAPL